MKGTHTSIMIKFVGVISHPADASRTIFSGERNKKQLLGSIALVACEVFIIVACLEYWWFGQAYMIATLLFFSIIFGVACIPTLSWKKHTYGPTMEYHSLLLLPPAIASCVVIVLFRLGFVDYIDRYLYRSPLLMSFFFAFVSIALIWKGICRAKINERIKPRVKIVQFTLMYFIDVAMMLGIVLFFLNYNGIFAWLDGIFS
ncbi:MAG: hypothetical protein ACTSUE_27410 [Promethearchaeota archaeon]